MWVLGEQLRNMITHPLTVEDVSMDEQLKNTITHKLRVEDMGIE